jgi:hypothetical protein
MKEVSVGALFSVGSFSCLSHWLAFGLGMGGDYINGLGNIMGFVCFYSG